MQTMKNPWPDPWTQGETNNNGDSTSEFEWDVMHNSRLDNLDRSSLFSPSSFHHPPPSHLYENRNLRRSSLPPLQHHPSPFSTEAQQLPQPPPLHHQQQHDHPFPPMNDQSQFIPKVYTARSSPSPQPSTFGSFHQQPFASQASSEHGYSGSSGTMHRREYHPVKRAPPVDMIEIGNKVQIIVELPGLKRENLKIDIHDKSHFLTLKGRYERDEYGEEVNFLMNERTHGKFRRRIRLPQYADIDHVQANMKDGLLIIEMPSLKKHEIFKKKRVINVEGLHQSEEPSTYSKARRFEWADQDRTQVSTATDTTVHHHVK